MLTRRTGSTQAGRDAARVTLPVRLVTGVLTISCLILLVGVLVPPLLDARTDATSEQLTRVAGFEAPNSMAVWWSSILFALVAVLAYSRSRDLGGSGPVPRGWWVLAVLFLWTSFDHATHAHVEFARGAHRFLHVPEGLQPLSLLILGCAAAAAVPVYRAARGSARVGLLVAGILLVLGGWGVDALGQVLSRPPDLVSRALESGLEWAGLVVMVALLLGRPEPG